MECKIPLKTIYRWCYNLSVFKHVTMEAKEDGMIFNNSLAQSIAVSIFGGIFILGGIYNIFCPMYEDTGTFYNLDVSFLTIAFGIFVVYAGLKSNGKANVPYRRRSLKENALRVVGWILALWITMAGGLTVFNLSYNSINHEIVFLSFMDFMVYFVSILPGLILLILGFSWIKFLRKQ